jgi:hypothetical protein
VELAHVEDRLSGPRRVGPATLHPTPVAPPRFRILRPTWLPEVMSVPEEHRQLATRGGPVSSAMVHIDATSSVDLENALLLLERPKDAIADPQDVPGTIETTGGPDVRIGRRSQACMNLCPASRARSRPRWSFVRRRGPRALLLRGCAQGCGIGAPMTGLHGTEERHRSRIRRGKEFS